MGHHEKARPEEVMETPFLKTKTKNKPTSEHLGPETEFKGKGHHFGKYEILKAHG